MNYIKRLIQTKSLSFLFKYSEHTFRGVPFGYPLVWVIISYCGVSPYCVILKFNPCGLPLLCHIKIHSLGSTLGGVLINVGRFMMLKFLKPTAKNQFQRRKPTYYYYSWVSPSSVQKLPTTLPPLTVPSLHWSDWVQETRGLNRFSAWMQMDHWTMGQTFMYSVT